jgi:hypothetical protein
MRMLVACFLATCAIAAAQAPVQPPSSIRTCPDCGEVRSVRVLSKELRADPMRDDVRPSGLVATIPLGGGKASAGSSTRIGREAATTVDVWEIIIRLDDGRYRLINVDQAPDVSIGDKVRVEANGRIAPRTD